MENILKKHRVIGIRSALKSLKKADLISKDINYPSDAVDELKKVQTKANSAKRSKAGRSDAGLPAMIRTIEKTYKLPEGSVQLVYPSGRKVRSDATVGNLRKKWQKS
jgi:hypothetical protein